VSKASNDPIDKTAQNRLSNRSGLI